MRVNGSSSMPQASQTSPRTNVAFGSPTPAELLDHKRTWAPMGPVPAPAVPWHPRWLGATQEPRATSLAGCSVRNDRASGRRSRSRAVRGRRRCSLASPTTRRSSPGGLPSARVELPTPAGRGTMKSKCRLPVRWQRVLGKCPSSCSRRSSESSPASPSTSRTVRPSKRRPMFASGQNVHQVGDGLGVARRRR